MPDTASPIPSMTHTNVSLPDLRFRSSLPGLEVREVCSIPFSPYRHAGRFDLLREKEAEEVTERLLFSALSRYSPLADYQSNDIRRWGMPYFPFKLRNASLMSVLHHLLIAIRTPDCIAGHRYFISTPSASRFRKEEMHCKCKHHLENDDILIGSEATEQTPNSVKGDRNSIGKNTTPPEG